MEKIKKEKPAKDYWDGVMTGAFVVAVWWMVINGLQALAHHFGW